MQAHQYLVVITLGQETGLAAAPGDLFQLSCLMGSHGPHRFSGWADSQLPRLVFLSLSLQYPFVAVVIWLAGILAQFACSCPWVELRHRFLSRYIHYTQCDCSKTTTESLEFSVLTTLKLLGIGGGWRQNEGDLKKRNQNKLP